MTHPDHPDNHPELWRKAQEAHLASLTVAELLAVPGVLELALEEGANEIARDYELALEEQREATLRELLEGGGGPARFELLELPLSEARELAAGRAFRAPHYTASVAAVVGELALAAGGVLYLDQLESWSRSTVHRLGQLLRAQLQSPALVVSPCPLELEGSAPVARLRERWQDRRAILADYARAEPLGGAAGDSSSS